MHNIGLGLRKEIIDEILALKNNQLSFIELAPENWMQTGGKLRQMLLRVSAKFPLTCHGLSLSLGSPEDLDWNFLRELKKFIKEFSIRIYSEHLSYCKIGNAHLYNLLPIPFTQEAVLHLAKRIRQVQDFLERKIAIENITYYCSISPEMKETEFLTHVLNESDCELLLDVNNVYVNAFNHKYDPYEFLKEIPLNKVSYLHIAGHERVSSDLIIDTHGSPLIDPVYQLFEWVVAHLFSPVPVLLERDCNFEDFHGLLEEVGALNYIIEKYWKYTNVSC